MHLETEIMFGGGTPTILLIVEIRLVQKSSDQNFFFFSKSHKLKNAHITCYKKSIKIDKNINYSKTTVFSCTVKA